MNLRRIGLDEVRRAFAACSLAAGLLLVAEVGARAQDPANTPPAEPADAVPAPPAGAAPAPAPGTPKLKKKGDKDTDTATSNASDQPVWDPLRAEKDIQIGHYYMNKGDTDAAIDRFEDAIVAKPGFAIPYLYLGEAQEKKGQKRLAIKSYTRYLDLLPHAEDAAKIRKRIDKLYKDLEKDKK